jgi:hypothetical protein
LTKPKVSNPVQEIRDAAEASLLVFARLMNPKRVYGAIHEELFRWWTRPGAQDNQLVLLPRDHQKSHCAAVRALWELTRDPTHTILYISATADLAEKQLYAIKSMMESSIYQRYWPEMLNSEEGRRTRWTTEEVIVDHPKRKAELIRDPSIKAVGLTANVTGFHASMVFLDDLVVPRNAYTEEGRNSVASMYSQLASIETTGAKEIAVGTRYHPNDLYNVMMEMTESVFNDEGEVVDEANVYEIFEKVVETHGEFLWPRTQRDDGKWFGFDSKELARKKAKYVGDPAQFFAQYYNNPNAPGSERIRRDKFQYYDRKLLRRDNGNWYLGSRRLNIFAAIDFAFSLNKKADYTSIVVIGVTAEWQIYVLDIDRFRTDSISGYWEHLFYLYNKWQFRKLRAEVSVAQKIIVQDLKQSYIVPLGLAISIDEHHPNRTDGSKEERMAATLEPKYNNLQMWHYQGGNCSLLEEELCLARPPHDDIKDALTAAIDVAVAPARQLSSTVQPKVVYHPRFGGV